MLLRLWPRSWSRHAERAASRPGVYAVLVGAALWALLFSNAAALRAGWDLTNLGPSRRYWEDLTVAVVNYQHGVGRLSAGQPYGWEGGRVAAKLREILPPQARDAGLAGWQFWRTLPARVFRHVEPLRLDGSDDVGRSWLATWGFCITGGVAPYLPVWLPMLAMLPLFVWTLRESAAAGHGLAGAIFLLLLGLSAYVAEVLTLPYSAVGFLLVGLLLVVALATYSLLGARVTPLGLMARCLCAGIVLAVCVLCRSGCLALAPALCATVALGAVRVRRGEAWPTWRAALLGAAGLALLLGPYLLARPGSHHEAWVGIWEGLGDFDRDKGHVWSDAAARDALRAEGYVFTGYVGPSWDAEKEAILRRLVLRDIASDPVWYARILAQRVTATVLQLRLWPRRSVDRRSFTRHASLNEGSVDTYYQLTRTADWFGVRGRLVELPLVVLWVPLLSGVTIAIIALARPGCRGLPLSRGPLGVAGVLALAALPLPVLVTTCSGPETQAFTLVYLLLAAFLVEAAVRRVVGAWAGRSAH